MSEATPFIIVGARGTALPVDLLQLEDGLHPGENKILWNSKKPTALDKKTVAWVSPRNKTIQILDRRDALQRGIIKAIPSVSWQKNGKRYTGTAFVKAECDLNRKQPRYVAVDCPEWGHGVVESELTRDGRNEHLVALLTVPKPTPAAPSSNSAAGQNDSATTEPGEFYEEGKEWIFIGTAYERDPVARAECIRIYGCRCFVCGFDFADEYGDLGAGFIHVHHEVPVHTGERQTNAAKDLKPLCPNCHAMIHRQKTPLSVDQLKRIVEGWRKQKMEHQVL